MHRKTTFDMTELKDLHMIGPSARPDTGGTFFILSSEQELIIVNPEYCSCNDLEKGNTLQGYSICL